MNPAEGFVEFVRIVDAGSVSEAARQLGVPRPTLSRRLADLETALGVRLLHRRTRSMTLTQAGEALLPRARQVVESAQQARQAVALLDETPRGRLRLTMPPDLQLSECLLAFTERWPEVQLEVLAATRRVALVAEGFDVALRAGPVGDESLVARTLARVDTVCVAAPEAIEAFGCPTHPEDLASLPCLLHTNAAGEASRLWPLRDGGRVEVQESMSANDLRLLLTFALAGRGFALLPASLTGAAIAAGSLQPILCEQVGHTALMRVVVVEKTFMEPKIRAFIDHVVAWVAARPGLLPEVS